MRDGRSEDVIRIRVLPEEATEVAEWAGLMLSELVGNEADGDGKPVQLRDPERAAELLELLLLCAEEGADATSALEPAMRLCGAVEGEENVMVKEAGHLKPAQALPNADLFKTTAVKGTDAEVQRNVSTAAESCDTLASSGYPADWHPYYGTDRDDFGSGRNTPPAYRSSEERDEVLMAVRFGASALIDLAQSHGIRVPK
ncbi:hypothetical protein [Saccharibacillus kuerlensis]|uniref:Uncharacterized protein n=1 Tax=Saccharibacillus kuerlensis TaxID=459527 RepID=A0ABQ2KV46_9BACL|nr:hypothetical protein [Saccharibacillus kuerlensis]GGN94174.1 hypothetical protein GCM10010969_08660 [Saccharibacillus kuerlensis]